MFFKKSLLYTTFIGLISFCFSGLSAQDFHFSQIGASPLQNNPANTGHFKGDWRVVNNYRKQWNAISIPFNTLSISYDQQIYIYSQNISAGLYILNDKSGMIGLNTNKIFGSIAYHTHKGKHGIHGGIQPGIVFRNYDYSVATMPDQFDMSIGYFNPEMLSSEENIGERRGFFDLNVGAIYSYKLYKLLPEIGVSFFNVNVPKESFNSKEFDNRIPFKQIYSANIDIPINNKFSVTPRYFYMRERKAIDQVFGADLFFNIPVNEISLKRIKIACYIRDAYLQKSDAIIVILGAEVYKVFIAINYDFNISPLSEATNFRGAFELSLIYTELSTVFNKFTLPCIRY